MYKLALDKAEEPEIKLPTSTGSQIKQENSRKMSTFASLTVLKPLTVWITKNYGKFFKRWEYQTTLTCLQRNLYAHQEETVKTIQEQLTSSKPGKEYFKAVYCHPAYLTYMQSTS